MREIKFRYRIKIFKTGEIVTRHFTLHDVEQKDFGHNMLKPDSEVLSRDEFTELLDSGGKEIYEGDILEYKGICGAVVFDNGSFTLDDPFKMSVVWATKHGLKHSFNAFEIIGNIYENFELLK